MNLEFTFPQVTSTQFEAFCTAIEICGFIENFKDMKDKPLLILLEVLEIICSLISFIPDCEVFRIAAILLSILREMYLMNKFTI